MHRTLTLLYFRSIASILICLLFTVQTEAQSSKYEQAFSSYQTQKFDEAEAIWTELANAGDVNAQYALGVMHLRQEASDAAPAAAFSWFEKAASQGHATAMFNLGVAYWEGTGVAQDKSKALSLWEESALKGDSGAQFNLGLAYYIGEERNPDLGEASKWIGLAADQNHPEATRILAVIKSELATSGETATVATMQSSGSAADGQKQTASVSNEIVKTPVENESPPTEPLKRFWKSTDADTSLYDKADGTAFRTLLPGTPLEIIGQDGGWASVTLPDGLRTWIFSKFIDIDNNQGVINADAVRIRPKPSTNNSDSPPIGKYQRGDRVEVISTAGEWVEIRAPKKVGAWLKVEDIVEYKDTEANRDRQWQQALAAGM